jgi:hypothetical protein
VRVWADDAARKETVLEAERDEIPAQLKMRKIYDLAGLSELNARTAKIVQQFLQLNE